MSLKSQLHLFVSTILQKRKSVKQFFGLQSFVKKELQHIDAMPQSKETRQGTLVVKCDDIGDFLVWQQVIPVLKSKAKSPLYFVGNKAIKSLYETYFDFADKVIWLDKSLWHDAAYRHELYNEISRLNVQVAFSPLFTRNFTLDDLLVLASHAPEKPAWSVKHHTYFPDFKLLENRWTSVLQSDKPVQLEYFRNNELISKLYNASIPEQFQVLFPNFNKHNTLVVVPVASAKSKSWKAEYFAQCINKVKPHFDRIILLGGANTIAVASQIAEQVNDSKLINLVDQTKLNELFAFIGEARLLLTVDTFAAHMGPLCATDTVVIGNGTNWQRFGDYEGKIKSGFKLILPPGYKKDYAKTKVHYSSSEIQEIEVDTVVKAIEGLLKVNQPG